MSIIGVKRLVFGLDEIETSERFFSDFGLDLAIRDGHGVRFDLAEGSSIELRLASDPELPAPFLEGNAPREVIWGVSDRQTLDAITRELSRDRPISVDAKGTLHTRDDIGIAIRIRDIRSALANCRIAARKHSVANPALESAS